MSVLANRPFAPARKGATVQQAVAVAQASLIKFDNVLPPSGGFSKSNTVRLVNAGPNTIFFEFTGADDTAERAIEVNSANPLLPGADRVFTASGTCLLVQTKDGPSLLYATPGEGI